MDGGTHQTGGHVFEIRHKDAAGRVGRWKTPRGEVTTPEIAIVVNPHVSVVSPEEIRGMGFQLLITNSYVLMNSDDREEILEEGIHEYLGWDGPVYTDSGAFQYYSQDVDDIDPTETVEFQRDMGSDIVTPLDVFTLPSDTRDTVREKLEETERRYSDMSLSDDTLVAGPVQGGRFTDFRGEASRMAASHSFDLHPVGGIVPLMENYDYTQLSDIVVTCKKNLPHDRPVHAFGAGHPMVFSFLAALGCDIFDSAMYALAAREGRYLTVNGTEEFSSLTELPCSCNVCTSHSVNDLREMEEKERERQLTLHNLHVTREEIRRVRDSIRRGRLWELAAQRARNHPRLREALLHVLKEHPQYFEELDPVTKSSALFDTGEEVRYRPEVRRAKRWVGRVNSPEVIETDIFGDVPKGLTGTYPMGQTVTSETLEMPDPERAVRDTLDYLYGSGVSEAFGDMEIETSRTGRPRKVYAEDELIGTVRARDGSFVPTLEGARRITEVRREGNCVVVDEEAEPYVAEGNSVFAKFVLECEGVRSGQEVAVLNNQGELLATGTALLSETEMRDMDRGVAVTVRHYVGE